MKDDFRDTDVYFIHKSEPLPLAITPPDVPSYVAAVEGPHTKPGIVARVLYWWRLRRILKMGPNL